jgi:hypothetical protein
LVMRCLGHLCCGWTISQLLLWTRSLSTMQRWSTSLFACFGSWMQCKVSFHRRVWQLKTWLQTSSSKLWTGLKCRVALVCLLFCLVILIQFIVPRTMQGHLC